MPAVLQLEKTIDANTSGLSCAALSGTGRLVLTGEQGGLLRLWDVNSGHLLNTLIGHSDNVNSLDISADDRFVLSVGDDKALRFWDLASGHCERTLMVRSAGVTCVRFSGDGRYAVSGTGDDRLQFWELARGLCLATTLITLCSQDQGVRWIWLSETAEQVLAVRRQVVKYFIDNDWPSDLPVPISPEPIMLWRPRTGELAELVEASGPVHVLDDPSDALVARDVELDIPNVILNCNLLTGEHKHQYVCPSAPQHLAHTAIERSMVAACGHQLVVWRVDAESPAQIIDAHGTDIIALCSSRSGDRVLTAATSGELRIWHVHPESK